MILWRITGGAGETLEPGAGSCDYLPGGYGCALVDTLRSIKNTGKDIVQVKADNFMPNYSGWFGSSTVFANLALAKPDEWTDRQEWTWVHFAGDWQKQGPTSSRQEFYCEKGFAKLNEFGVGTWTYKNKQTRPGLRGGGYLLAMLAPWRASATSPATV